MVLWKSKFINLVSWWDYYSIAHEKNGSEKHSDLENEYQLKFVHEKL